MHWYQYVGWAMLLGPLLFAILTEPLFYLFFAIAFGLGWIYLALYLMGV